MLKIKLKELIARREFELGKRILIQDIAAETGINRMTLSKMANHRGYSSRTENLDRLCAYFGCRIEDLLEYVPDSAIRENQAEAEE